MVRSESRLQEAIDEIAAFPGLVLHTLVEAHLREALEDACRGLNLSAIAVLDPLTVAFSRYLGAPVINRVGAQHALDNDYFDRIEALNFAISHDDGALVDRIRMADVVLVGVSRTSKTPTCIYLAHRGLKAANIPLVPGRELPDILDHPNAPLVVGLMASPDRLQQIRRNRLLASEQAHLDGTYTDLDAIRRETIEARRLFENKGWPVIDVTRRSVEETAAQIISLLKHKLHL